jgi:hypothetical protein
MKKEFSFYEFTGIFLPGVTLLFGAMWIYPETKVYLFAKDLTVGGFGVFVIAAYLAGHLVQSVGNLVEFLGWAFTGKPTHWISRQAPPYLNDTQCALLPAAVESITGMTISNRTALTRKETNSLRGQIYARVKKEGRADRIDIFNGNYGMFRGILAACLVVSILGLRFSGWNCKSQMFWVPLVIGGVAGLRCYRFGVHYASELYWQALDVARLLQTPTEKK